MVRIVFDICHYEAVGAIKISESAFPPDEKPRFQVKYFYRGLYPLFDPSHLNSLPIRGIPLDIHRINYWQDGYTIDGTKHEEAKLVIRDKLENPFKKITTFRDNASRLGFIFHCIFNSSKQYPVSDISDNIEGITTEVEHTIHEKKLWYSHKDLVTATKFVYEEILSNPEVERTLACRKIEMI